MKAAQQLPLREHDLPPRWDDRTVRWAPWQDQPEMHICPPPRERDLCPSCGSLGKRVTARGLLAHRRGTTVEAIDSYDRGHRVGKVGYWTLVAFRCVDCGHDQVWDMRREELWDLDLSDYGAQGSVDPAGRW